MTSWNQLGGRPQCTVSLAHPFSDAFVLGQGYNGLDVFLRQLGHRHAVVLAAYVIGQDDGSKHREAVAGVQRAVVVVVVDASQFLVRQSVSRLVSEVYHRIVFLFFLFKFEMYKIHLQFHLLACSCPPDLPIGWRLLSVGGGQRRPYQDSLE